jgi:threonine dehydratase
MISKHDIETAYDLIHEHLTQTPVVDSRMLSRLCECEAFFKLESLQDTGSFKERGALNKMIHLTPAQREIGVITASAGNHAQGVARHAQRLGIRAKIVMPSGAPLMKVVQTRDYGVEVVLHGATFDDAYEHARRLEAEEGLVFIHPFDDAHVITGQGTIGLELINHPIGKTAEVVVCPIGGGGLIGGVALYLKESNPDIKIIGVESAAFPSMHQALQHGGPVKLPPGASLADGISVRQVGQLTYELAKKYVDEVVTVEEDEIAGAVLMLLELEKIMVEGSGAVPLAAMMKYKHLFAGRRTIAIVSGGNIDINILNRIITRGLSAAGRIAELKVRVRDAPGTLLTILDIVRRMQSNVMDIAHHRADAHTPFGYVDVALTLETKGHTHITEVRQALQAEGFSLS